MNTTSSSFYSVQTLLEEVQGDPDIVLKTVPGALCVFRDVMTSATSFCVTSSSINCLVSSLNVGRVRFPVNYENNLLSISHLIHTDPDNNFQNISDLNGVIYHVTLLIYERKKGKDPFSLFSPLVLCCCLFV